MVASRAANGKLSETLLPPLTAWETESLSGMGRSSGIALSGERARDPAAVREGVSTEPFLTLMALYWELLALY